MADSDLQKVVVDVLGLGSPFLYAGATFACFRFVEDRVSDEAKAAIAGWINHIRNDQGALANAFVETFDLIFGTPLLSIRAFGRCALFSTLVTFAILGEQGFLERSQLLEGETLYLLFVVNVLPNIISDYISLYVVRKSLTKKRGSPARSLLVATIAGAGVVFLFFLFRGILMGTSLAFTQVHNILDPGFWTIAVVFGIGVAIGDLFVPFDIGGGFLLLPALAIHIWMPLFALGLVLTRLAKYLEGPLAFLRWFFKDGTKRPVETIGYVVAPCVFILLALAKYADFVSNSATAK